jgi:hypothetical protein
MTLYTLLVTVRENLYKRMDFDSMLLVAELDKHIGKMGLTAPAAMPPSVPVPTSEAAAEAVMDDTEAMRRRIMQLIRELGPTTCDAVEVELTMKHQTASARIRDLVKQGLLVDSGLKGRTRSGCEAIRWVATR